MGGNPFLFVTSPLVVVFKVNLQRGLAQPGESDAVVSGHAHRPALRFALQTMKAKTRNVHVLGAHRQLEQVEDTRAFRDPIGADAASLAGEVKLLKSFMPEAADHALGVNYMIYVVNQIVV